MENKSIKKGIGEYEFLKLFASTTVFQKQDSIINKNDIERNLYDFSNDLDYSFMFENISRKDNNYINLSDAFKYACSFGLLLEYANDNYLINLSEKESRSIISCFDFKEINAMDKMCSILAKKDEKSKVKEKNK